MSQKECAQRFRPCAHSFLESFPIYDVRLLAYLHISDDYREPRSDMPVKPGRA